MKTPKASRLGIFASLTWIELIIGLTPLLNNLLGIFWTQSGTPYVTGGWLWAGLGILAAGLNLAIFLSKLPFMLRYVLVAVITIASPFVGLIVALNSYIASGGQL